MPVGHTPRPSAQSLDYQDEDDQFALPAAAATRRPFSVSAITAEALMRLEENLVAARRVNERFPRRGETLTVRRPQRYSVARNAGMVEIQLYDVANDRYVRRAVPEGELERWLRQGAQLVARQPTISDERMPTRLDVLYGVNTVLPQNAMRGVEEE